MKFLTNLLKNKRDKSHDTRRGQGKRDFFTEYSREEQLAVYKEAARLANEEQRALFKEA